jgi:hypothetical protein
MRSAIALSAAVAWRSLADAVCCPKVSAIFEK